MWSKRQEYGTSQERWFPLYNHRCVRAPQKKLQYNKTRPAITVYFVDLKMAVSDEHQGYQCEFIDPVSDDFYCKKCSLVARKLSFTSCCGESYCQTCIADILQQVKPCPACGVEKFEAYPQIKFQQRIRDLQVYCSMKRRGCGWCGTLEQLDTHLNPDLDNCQYVDTSCPFNCKQTIPKNKMEQHVAEECVQRDYGCQHCAFKATYEVVMDTHWPECVYLPLPCPNLCGVTCERGLMEDHMAMCRLQEVACEFTGVGCDRKLKREEQEEHTRQNTHKHLTITAAAAVKMKEQLHEQEQKSEQQELKLKNTLHKLEQTIKLQERKINEMEQKFRELLLDKSNQNEEAIMDINNFILRRTFEMKNFSEEKEKDEASDWKSPAMYTHVCGYKFCIGIDANGYGDRRGKAIYVDLWAMRGEYDHKLKWPVRARLTIELLHKEGGQSVKHSTTQEWNKPEEPYENLGSFGYIKFGGHTHFIQHFRLKNFLHNDALHFHITKITI